MRTCFLICASIALAYGCSCNAVPMVDAASDSSIASDAAPDVASDTSDASRTCDDAQHLCAGQCVSINSPLACGPSCLRCADVAGGTATCNDNVCAMECSAATPNRCPSACVNLDNDASNCGTCGNVCPNGQMCLNRACRTPPQCSVMQDPACAGITYCDVATRLCRPGCDGRVGQCPVNTICNTTTHECVCEAPHRMCGGSCATCPTLTNATGHACDGTVCVLSGCSAGYEPSSNNTQCVDINECSTDNGGCDVHATCANTTGSRTCSCNQGYSGNGLLCMMELPEWQANAYIKASNTGVSDEFGETVALSADGTTLAIGSAWESSSGTGVNSEPNEGSLRSGAVYVFVRTGTTWRQQAFIKPSANERLAEFGSSVALSADGSTLAVGALAQGGSPYLHQSGTVYIFGRTSDTWTEQALLRASNPGVEDLFGLEVSLAADGNTLAVAATYEDSSTTGVNSTPNEGADDSGAVYVFTRSASVWTEQAYLKSSNSERGDHFGTDVALAADGNTLAVGAEWEDSSSVGINGNPSSNALDRSGAAYVFARVGGTWSQQAYIKPSYPGSQEYFGHSVAVSSDGDTLAVSATHEGSSSAGVNSTPNTQAPTPYSGAVFVFVRAGTIWVQQAYIKASNPGFNDRFGSEVALAADGNSLAVGAVGESSTGIGVNSTPNDALVSVGAVYLFARARGAWSQLAFIKPLNSSSAYELFGDAVAISADGRTLAVGATNEDSATTGVDSIPDDNAVNSGAVYCYVR